MILLLDISKHLVPSAYRRPMAELTMKDVRDDRDAVCSAADAVVATNGDGKVVILKSRHNESSVGTVFDAPLFWKLAKEKRL